VSKLVRKLRLQGSRIFQEKRRPAPKRKREKKRKKEKNFLSEGKSPGDTNFHT